LMTDPTAVSLTVVTTVISDAVSPGLRTPPL